LVKLYFFQATIHFRAVKLYFFRVKLHFHVVNSHFRALQLHFFLLKSHFFKVTVHFQVVKINFFQVELYFFLATSHFLLGKVVRFWFLSALEAATGRQVVGFLVLSAAKDRFSFQKCGLPHSKSSGFPLFYCLWRNMRLIRINFWI